VDSAAAARVTVPAADAPEISKIIFKTFFFFVVTFRDNTVGQTVFWNYTLIKKE
jgi:hypothetical protein